MDVTFNNMRVTISGVESAEEAYDRLCNALASIESRETGEGIRHVEWLTHTYYTDEMEELAYTTDIMPTEESERWLTGGAGAKKNG